MGDNTNNVASEMDCAICLQKCHHPTQLPCGHIFCFLCLKGVALQIKKCALCRKNIPPNYLDNPVLLEKLSSNEISEDVTDQYQWYYEGQNGWWKFDERSNNELENSWNSEATECSLLLVGALYRIDFQTMMQTRCNNPSRRRRLRRDTPTFPSKGIAGIKTIVNTEDSKSDSEENRVSQSEDSNTSPVEISNNETPESTVDTNDQVEMEHNEYDIVNTLRSLNLGSGEIDTHTVQNPDEDS